MDERIQDTFEGGDRATQKVIKQAPALALFSPADTEDVR
jgi:hypothetical protein